MIRIHVLTSKEYMHIHAFEYETRLQSLSVHQRQFHLNRDTEFLHHKH